MPKPRRNRALLRDKGLLILPSLRPAFSLALVGVGNLDVYDNASGKESWYWCGVKYFCIWMMNWDELLPFINHILGCPRKLVNDVNG